jgi:hypothetical protein
MVDNPRTLLRQLRRIAANNYQHLLNRLRYPHATRGDECCTFRGQVSRLGYILLLSISIGACTHSIRDEDGSGTYKTRICRGACDSVDAAALIGYVVLFNNGRKEFNGCFVALASQHEEESFAGIPELRYFLWTLRRDGTLDFSILTSPDASYDVQLTRSQTGWTGKGKRSRLFDTTPSPADVVVMERLSKPDLGHCPSFLEPADEIPHDGHVSPR